MGCYNGATGVLHQHSPDRGGQFGQRFHSWETIQAVFELRVRACLAILESLFYQQALRQNGHLWKIRFLLQLVLRWQWYFRHSLAVGNL
jgi:hypothetical protein